MSITKILLCSYNSLLICTKCPVTGKALIDFRNTWYKAIGLEIARIQAVSTMQNGKKDNPSEADINEIIDLYC